MRPWGYNLRPGDPKFWDGFDNPPPTKYTWTKSETGRKKAANAEKDPMLVGVGDPYKS
jgi:hypothetical protein